MGGSLREFFDAILPSEGWKCLFTLPNKRHHWFTDIAQMAEAATRCDAEGRTVYHGCAAFQSQSRKALNVRSLQCYRLDIDAGRGKAYPSAGEAEAALARWREAAGLPAPLVVRSGGGVHAYWPLRDPLDGRQWSLGAARLHAAVLAGGLSADPTTTRDLARILRPPGTHNRKSDPPALVAYSGPIPVYDDPFGGAPAVGIPTAPPDWLKGGGGLEDAVANVHAGSENDADPDAVARACRQVSRLRDARGRIAEPDWYAVLGVLAHCGEAGRALAHDWSSGDERYDRAAAEQKLSHAREASGPTTCARFQSLNPPGCQGCPHQGHITSPIQLGRGPLSPVVLAPKPATLDLPALPEGYFWRQAKLCTKVPAKKDEDPDIELVIADFPVFITGLIEGELTPGLAAVFRSWEPQEGRWREFPLPTKEALGERGLGALAHHGVAVLKKRWPHFHDFMVRSVNELKASRRYGRRYEQFGWKDGGFLIGDRLLTPTGEERAHGSPEVERRQRALEPRGDARAWALAANALFAEPAMTPHAFALLAAFAAPLYAMTGGIGCTIVHLASRSSGTGKTTSLMAGESIYAQWKGLQVGTRDTPVAKFIAMGTLCHLPVFWDELRYQDPEETKEYVLQATVGKDKLRGAADGGLRADSLTWATILISNSNPSLRDTVRWDGAEVAQAHRIFEYEPALPAGKTVAAGQALEAALQANAGSAGRVFLQFLVENRAWVEKAVAKALVVYERRVGGGSESRFIVRLLAAVAIAGVVAKKLGLFDADVGRVMAWAVETARSAQAKLAGDNSGEIGDILGGLINDLLPGTLVMPGPVRPGPRDLSYIPIREPRGELKARYEVDGRRLFLDERAVRAWMVRHKHSFSQAEDALTRAKALVAVKKKTLGAGAAMASGQVRAWEIDCNHELVGGLVDLLTETNVVPMRRA